MRAYVLVAGYATRLYPLTRDLPKALLPVGGRPLLAHLFDRLLGLPELTEIVLVSNHRFAPAFDAFVAAARCRVPIRVLDDGSTREENRLGATGDLAFALERVPVGGAPFLVVAGDNLLDFDLAPLWRRFLEAEASLLVVRPVVRDGGPSRYNEVVLDAEFRVKRFREKPPDAASPWAAIACYFHPPDVADRISEYLAAGGDPDAPGHFIAWLAERRPLVASPFDGAWYDIGTPETLAAARARFDEEDRAV
ncbi:MAG: nucleotidyltransferase family protein [Proteobacteria bacterium]|nr:nucleotidyltransferase family protein [Pseudomonadota bacterium]